MSSSIPKCVAWLFYGIAIVISLNRGIAFTNRQKRWGAENRVTVISRCLRQYQEDEGRLPVSLREYAEWQESFGGPSSLSSFILGDGGKVVGSTHDVDEWSDFVLVSNIGPREPKETIMLYGGPRCYIRNRTVVAFVGRWIDVVWMDVDDLENQLNHERGNRGHD